MALLDDFNRADGAIGSNWTRPNIGADPLQIASNKAAPNGANESNSFWSASTFTADQEVEFVLSRTSGSFTSGEHCYLLISVDSGSAVSFTGYLIDFIVVGTDTFEIDFYRCNSGTYTYLASRFGDFSASPGATIGVRKWGNFIVFLCNGIVNAGIYDTSVLTGAACLGAGLRAATNLRIDDFSGGDFTAVPAGGSGATPLLDDFNRADGALGSNWGYADFGPNMAIIQTSGTRAGYGTSSAQYNAVWTASTFGPNCEVEANLYRGASIFGADSQLMLMVPALSPTAFTGYVMVHGWLVDSVTSVLRIYRWNAGVATLLLWIGSYASSINGPPSSDGDLLTFRKNGSVLSIMRNGTIEAWVTDPAPLTTPGYSGFGGYNGTGIEIDNFHSGDISATAVATPFYIPAYTNPRRAIGTRFLKYLPGAIGARIGTQIQGTVAGATVFTTTMTANVSVTASLSKVVNKNLTATTVALTGSLSKLVNKTLTATSVAVTGSITKVVNKTLTATTTALSASLAKLINKNLTATVTPTASMIKLVNKQLTATVSETASIVKLIQKTLTATTVTTSASIAKEVVIIVVVVTDDLDVSHLGIFWFYRRDGWNWH